MRILAEQSDPADRLKNRDKNRHYVKVLVNAKGEERGGASLQDFLDAGYKLESEDPAVTLTDGHAIVSIDKKHREDWEKRNIIEPSARRVGQTAKVASGFTKGDGEPVVEIGEQVQIDEADIMSGSTADVQRSQMGDSQADFDALSRAAGGNAQVAQE